MITYHIKGWKTHFETTESKRTKHLTWVAIPNKHDGKSYRRLTRHPRAAEVFAAWNLMLQVASKAKVRGSLVSDDGPLDAGGLSDMTGFPESIFVLAFEVLTDKRIGWLEVESAGVPCGTAGVPSYRTEQDRTGHTGQDTAARAGVPADRDSELTATDPATTPSIRPEDAWSYESSQNWVTLLRAIVGQKLGPKTWTAWKRLVTKYGIDQVCEAAEGLTPDKRWPSETETDLIEGRTVTSPARVDPVRERAKRLVKQHGQAKIEALVSITFRDPDEAIEALTENPGLADTVERGAA